MEPATKKRKLAPKVNTSIEPRPQNTQHHHDPPPHYSIPEPQPEHHAFESFARHLQDAAMLIQRQTERPRYTDVSVLLLNWEGDTFSDKETTVLETVLRTTYHYHTQRWEIPSCPHPTIKLGVQIASFLENPRPDHLLIIHYAGHGFVGQDGQLYWASNEREDSSKLKWDGIRCLFEDAQSDMLLLLDTCGIPNPGPSGSHGVKQAISANMDRQEARQANLLSLTAAAAESLRKLSNAQSFSTRQLYEEIIRLQQRHSHQATPSSATATSPIEPGFPVFLPLTAGDGQDLNLAPVLSRSINGHSVRASAKLPTAEQQVQPEDVAEIRFDEQRVLVCTTFVGEASPDMSSFHKWLQNPPLMGEKISVEGMFLGPPLMLLISMPHAVWNIVQHDKVCCFLGYISTHNMLHLYDKLIRPTSRPDNSLPPPDNPHTLYDARKSAVEALARTAEHERHPPKEQPSFHMGKGGGLAALKPKEEHEGTAEMREAAEQLKALSHVRHLSNESTPASARPRTSLPNGSAHSDKAFRDGDERSPSKQDSPTSRVKVPRHALPKHETVCNHCSHAPFRDSSSLRKHIAAAHTRPFPCAFSFAGCNSTFGSKNEWKRHITSQHLCLQYYRCSACPKSTVEGKGNEFNRKDLFTQHLRRMHAPFQIKRPPSKVDNKIEADWEVRVKQMQESCLVQRRQPPQKGACPKYGCFNVFEGHTAWDEWTEHVGRHMEKGEAGGIGIDQNLIDWAVQEKIIAPKGGNEYRLCYHGAGAANGAGKENCSPITTEKKDEKDKDKGKDTEKTGDMEVEPLSASTTTSTALSQPALTAGTSQTEPDTSPKKVKADSPADGDHDMVAV